MCIKDENAGYWQEIVYYTVIIVIAYMAINNVYKLVRNKKLGSITKYLLISIVITYLCLIALGFSFDVNSTHIVLGMQGTTGAFLLFAFTPVFTRLLLSYAEYKSKSFDSLIASLNILWAINTSLMVLSLVAFISSPSTQYGIRLMLLNFSYLNLLIAEYCLRISLRIDESKISAKVPVEDTKHYEVVFCEIDKLINSKELFKHHGLSLSEVSKHTGFPIREISRAINLSNETSFKEYINKLRLLDFLMLYSPDNRESIMKGAFQAGFSSKSTFNKVFKQYLDITPTELYSYRNEKREKKLTELRILLSS